jgi:hypothetical protein
MSNRNKRGNPSGSANTERSLLFAASQPLVQEESLEGGVPFVGDAINDEIARTECMPVMFISSLQSRRHRGCLFVVSFARSNGCVQDVAYP